MKQRNIRIALALDRMNESEMFHLVETTEQYVDIYKIHDAVYRYGSQIIKKLAKIKPVFADMKIHDTPRSTQIGLVQLDKAGAGFVSVHAEEECLRAASHVAPCSKIIAVTELTSKGGDRTAEVLGKAAMAWQNGIINITCSAQEAATVRKQDWGKRLHCFIPGIEPMWAPKLRGQERTTEHREAVRLLGGNFTLVIGRAVTDAQNPLEALVRISKELDEVIAV